MYKAYIFDYDYTLAFSEPAIIMCFRHVFSAFSINGVDDAAIKRTIGMPLNEALAMFAGSDDENLVTKMHEKFSEKADEVMSAHTVLYPEVLPLFSRLSEFGAKLAIVSNKRGNRISEVLERYGILDKVEVIIGAEDINSYKPDPEGLESAINSLNVSKLETLYVGDSMIDSLTAKNAGVDFVGVTTGTTKASEFATEPYIKIIASLDEL